MLYIYIMKKKLMIKLNKLFNQLGIDPNNYEKDKSKKKKKKK